MSKTVFGLLEQVQKKEIKTLTNFLDFLGDFLTTIDYRGGLAKNMQATIIATNNPDYCFFQYREDHHFSVTRPVNKKLMVELDEFEALRQEFEKSVKDPKKISKDQTKRSNINRVVYSCQQAIGCTLDALNNSNKAKKQNGVYFEELIRAVVSESGVGVCSEDKVVQLSGQEKLKFERDIVLLNEDVEKAVGQLKTSTKDRIDKIFLDKLVYQSQVEDIPFFAIILNDMQRSTSRQSGKYKTNSTFLPGHFKAYTIALTPLDGVYYIDLTKTMTTDATLTKLISPFDKFLVEDMWRFIE